MAREEHHREDLFRESTALVRRVELKCNNEVAPIVAGFRAGSQASFFFAEEFALHFNANGELRRAYVGGLLIKAVDGRLHGMRRERFADELVLRSAPLTADEETDFLRTVRQRFAALAQSIDVGDCRTLRSIPEGADVVGEVRRWLEKNGQSFGISIRPHIT